MFGFVPVSHGSKSPVQIFFLSKAAGFGKIISFANYMCQRHILFLQKSDHRINCLNVTIAQIKNSLSVSRQFRLFIFNFLKNSGQSFR